MKLTLQRVSRALEADRVLFHWCTETYCDDDDGLLNEFQMVLRADGHVEWRFNFANMSCYDYDLFTGLYYGGSRQELVELFSGFIPEFEEWIIPGIPTSTDANGNCVPDECEAKGDLNDDGNVDLGDLPAFLDCLDGPDVAIEASCARADFDNNADVDLKDIALFQATFEGPPP